MILHEFDIWTECCVRCGITREAVVELDVPQVRRIIDPTVCNPSPETIRDRGEA